MPDTSSELIEPRFLLQAFERQIPVSITLMNRTTMEGIVGASSKHEISISVQGTPITLRKQEISSIIVAEQLIPVTSGAQSDAASGDTQHAKPNIQTEFLDRTIKDGQPVTVFLLTGQRTKTAISAYDNYTILTPYNDGQRLFYKHSITSLNR